MTGVLALTIVPKTNDGVFGGGGDKGDGFKRRTATFDGQSNAIGRPGTGRPIASILAKARIVCQLLNVGGGSSGGSPPPSTSAIA